MNHSLKECHEILDSFWESGAVGVLFFHRAPHGREMNAWIERVLKREDMDEPTWAAMSTVLDRQAAIKVEMVCSKDDKPDRIKTTRRL